MTPTDEGMKNNPQLTRTFHVHVYNMAGVCVECGHDADALATDHSFCPSAPPVETLPPAACEGCVRRLDDGGYLAHLPSCWTHQNVDGDDNPFDCNCGLADLTEKEKA